MIKALQGKAAACYRRSIGFEWVRLCMVELLSGKDFLFGKAVKW